MKAPLAQADPMLPDREVGGKGWVLIDDSGPPLILSVRQAEGRLRRRIHGDTIVGCWRFGSDVYPWGIQVMAGQLEMASLSFLFEAYLCTRASAARQSCIRG